MTAVQTSLRPQTSPASGTSQPESPAMRRGLPSTRWSLWTKLALDLAVMGTAVAVAMALRLQGTGLGTGLLVLAGLPMLRVGLLAARGGYSQSWRQFALDDVVRIVPALLAPTLALLAVRTMVTAVADALPMSAVALEGLMAGMAVLSLRGAVRLLDERVAREQADHAGSGQPARRVLLVGAGRAGGLAARELRRRPDVGYRVVGFLDDDATLKGRRIEGLEVLGTTADAQRVANARGVDCIILTLPSATRAQRRAAVARCSAAGLEVRTVPGYFDLLAGNVGLTKIRPVRIDDLLGRNVVGIDPARWSSIVGSIAGKRVLVTGAGGSIGSELCRQIADLEPERLVLLEGNENNLFEIEGEIRRAIGERAVPCLADVRDEARLLREFEHHRPQVVFHAAAFKHVPMMELHPYAAIDNNVFGTAAVVKAAESVDVERFLFVSTDKAVNPANVMGASKRISEMVVQAHAATSQGRYCCVRFGNVLGSRGSVLHTFRRQIEAGGPVTVTHPEVTRFFMTIPEAVRLLIQSNAVQDGGEVFLLDMGEPVKITHLAQQMIQLSGLDLADIPIEFVGLRPGEKLYEELLRDDEGARPSGVEGIFHARLADVNPQTLRTWLAPLRKAARAHDESTIRHILSIAAGYRPDPEAAPVPPGLPAVKPLRVAV